MKSIKVKIIALLFLISTFVNLSCGDDYGDVPECIEDEIEKFKDDACDERASVKLYKFQNEDAFLFDSGICIADGNSDVLSNQCTVIGSLGGISGNVEVNGVNFLNNATLVEVIWEN